MRQPAGDHRVVAEDRLMRQQGMAKHDQRIADDEEGAKTDQAPEIRLQKPCALGPGKPVNKLTHGADKRNFNDRKHCREKRHEGQPRQHRARVMQNEGQQPRRRLAWFLLRKRVNPAFEESKNPFSRHVVI